jgi:hypothetical protein
VVVSDVDGDDVDDEDSPSDDVDDADAAEAGKSRYERKSAKLPSMGEDASKVVGKLEGFRKSLRGS